MSPPDMVAAVAVDAMLVLVDCMQSTIQALFKKLPTHRTKSFSDLGYAVCFIVDEKYKSNHFFLLGQTSGFMSSSITGSS